MVIANPTHSISHVRHPDKYQCVMMCIEKENAGFECIRKIEYVSHYHKRFNRDGKYMTYAGASEDGYWEAVYRMKFD